MAIAPAFAFAGVATAAPSSAHAAEAAAKCQVHSVLASKTGDGTIPDNLKFLADQLKSDSFAAYKSFRLLDTKQFALKLDAPTGAVMKSGHKLKLNFLGANEGKLKLHTKLLSRDDNSLFEARLQIHNNGMVWFGGVRHVKDKVFFAMHCVHATPQPERKP